MAYARIRGNTWSARWRTREGLSAEKSGFATRKLAVEFAEEQEALERKDKNTRPSEMNMTLNDFVLEIWAPSLDVTKQTKLDYQLQYNCHIEPVFGEKSMAIITPADIQKWRVRLKNSPARTGYQLSESTVNKLTNLLASILKSALDNDKIHNNPMSKVKRKKPKKVKKAMPLELETVQALANSLAPQWRILIWMGFFTGLRPSELMGLTWDRIDFEKEEILVDRQLSRFSDQVFEAHLKTTKSHRIIPLPIGLRNLLIEHKESFGLGPHGLILKNRSGKIWRYKDACAMYRDIARPLGVQKGDGLHQLRHTFVSTLIQLGVNAKQIQEWVGHESILETMDIYGHLFPNSLNELSKKLDDYVIERTANPPKQKMLA
jgi:integrase